MSASSPAALLLDPAQDYDFLCKLLIIGDSGSGKTSLLKRYADHSFAASVPSTIGVDFEVRTVKVADGKKTVKLQMWDTAGQERYRNITSSYYRGAHAVMIVIDVTSRNALASIRRWIDEFQRHTRDAETHMLVVANKIDLSSRRLASREALRCACEELGLDFIETSALDGTNVQNAFQSLAESIASGVILNSHICSVRIDSSAPVTNNGSNCAC